MTDKLKNELARCAEKTNNALADRIEFYRSSPLFHQDMSKLISSCEYSLLAGGKRLRPFLALCFSRLCDGDENDAMTLAASLEMVHTYSLIHDDLPCMDDDDYRRGKMTNHKVYGEARALLAGDTLLTDAFSLISESRLAPEIKIEAIKTLSKNAGILGMIGGQEIDLSSENKKISLETLFTLQSKKTGALIECACLFGCYSSGTVSKEKLNCATSFAKYFGLAFQITDDILDVVGNSKLLGKTVGSDEKSNKNTTVTHLGLEGARKMAIEYCTKAKSALNQAFSDKDYSLLAELCDFCCDRKN